MLANQFEFMMAAWVNSSTFPGAAAQAGIDPLLGNQNPDPGTFVYWEKGQPVTVNNLLRFVTTRGGLYCFIPSLTAIKWMAQNGGASDHWILPSIPPP
jgi:hypothetical protein